jgi:hypothetical protein
MPRRKAGIAGSVVVAQPAPRLALNASQGLEGHRLDHRAKAQAHSSNPIPRPSPTHPRGSLRAFQQFVKGAFIPIGSMTSGFPSRLMRLPAVPHDAAMHSTHPEMGHGLRCPQTMFTKQVSGALAQRGFPVVAAEAEQVERTR